MSAACHLLLGCTFLINIHVSLAHPPTDFRGDASVLQCAGSRVEACRSAEALSGSWLQGKTEGFLPTSVGSLAVLMLPLPPSRHRSKRGFLALGLVWDA